MHRKCNRRTVVALATTKRYRFSRFWVFLHIFRMEIMTIRHVDDRLTKIVFYRQWYNHQSDQYHGLINDLMKITVESLNDDEDVNVSLYLFNTYKLTFTHRTHGHTHTWLKCQNGMCGCVFHTRRKILFSLCFFFFFSLFVNPEEVPSDCTVAQFQHTQYHIEKEVHHTKQRRKKERRESINRFEKRKQKHICKINLNFCEKI